MSELPDSPAEPGLPGLPGGGPEGDPALEGGLPELLELLLLELLLLLLELLSDLLLELLSDLLLELLGDPEDEGGELELLGGVELGIDGGWGVVGLLALGQPVSSTQADAIAAKAKAGWRFATCLRVGLLGNFVGMDNSLSAHWLQALKSGAKPGSAQLAH